MTVQSASSSKRHRSTDKDAGRQLRNTGSLCYQPHWIILVILSLAMIYIDSKNISAYIIINDRPMSMEVSKYVKSITETIASVNKGAPALLRGSSDRSGHGISRQTSVWGSQNGEQVLKTLHQQLPVPNSILTYNNEATIHSLTIDKDEKDTTVTMITETPSTQPDTTEEPKQLPFGREETDSAHDRQSHDANQGSEHPKRMTRPKVLCLSGDSYGRTMNQYLQLATILHQLGINGTSVVGFKNPLFASFYTTWFEPRDDILVSYDIDAPCDAEYDAVTLHYLFFADKWKQVAYQFETLMPKASIQEEAERAMQEYAGPSNVPVTTVHRRDLEGACVLFAENKNLVTCPNIQSSLEMSSADYREACLIDYPKIANATQGTTVVLYTDGQVPELDATFPITSKHAFPVQSWMMAISHVHYGNPFSTVDLVVYFWRMALAKSKGDHRDRHMRPSACYKPTPTE